MESDRVAVRAGAAVVAVPPALRGRIDYRPALPAVQDGLSQRMPMGAVIKCHAIYDSPFWREAGLNGRAERHGSLQGHNRQLAARPRGRRAPTGFILGKEAREWGRRSTGERKAAVLECLARYLGGRAIRARAYGGSTGVRIFERRVRRSPRQDGRRITARSSGSPSAASTGRGPRRPGRGTDTWTAPWSRASGWRGRFWPAG